MGRMTGIVLLRAVLLSGPALLSASCSDSYLARRDTLSPGSGDAVQADIAKQVIDPWSAASSRTDLESDGDRVQHAMELYRNPSSGPTQATSSGSLAPPVVK